FGRRQALLADAVSAIRKAGGAAMHVAGDVAHEADVARLVEAVTAAHGGIDILVNAAAVRGPAAFTEVTPAEFEGALRTNLLGAFIVTRAVVAPMRARGGGSVIHIGSALGTVAVPLFAPYIASKGGLHMLAKAAAIELVGDGIRVNVVAPGTIDTDVSGGVSEFRRRMIAHRIPIGRPGHVDDVARACLYLASDAARYVTGSVLAVDGGWTAS
ncbi:MAG TPA: SDR family NAD(P)-dependent oxidoreductase, partial [Candidatus Limnocylindria bacterium]|nr:SDR family NAD(P)-dependent oxidoreductase [Candidatus Limnocylindria bacterium]